MTASMAKGLWFNRLHVFYAFGNKKYTRYADEFCPEGKPFKENRVGFYRFAISTNLSSVARIVREKDWRRSSAVSLNPLISVEPEVFLNKKLSVKGVANIGVQYNSRGETFTQEQTATDPSLDTSKLYVGPWYYFNNSTQWTIPTLNADQVKKDEITHPHWREIKYEIGIQPKYYFTASNNVLAPYAGAGIYFGQMNSYQVSYYHTFDGVYVDNWYGVPINKTFWTADSYTVSTNAPFNYIRGQFMTGININAFSFASLGLEMAYGTVIKNNGPSDLVYARKVGEEYELIHERPFEFNKSAGNFSLRAYFMIHLGKLNCR
jgi:hypothetical protein